MRSLSVRKLDHNVYERLRLRAAAHKVSMEEEVRQIISQAVLGSVSGKFSGVFRKYFSEDNGIDLDIPNQRMPHDPMDFSK